LIAMWAAAAVTAPASIAEARVTKLVVEQKRIFADGTSFGEVGQYERLDGTAYFAVDPTDSHNSFIVNLDKAPRNKAGLVEFTAPFFILKPVDMARGNHKLWYGINNRGNKQTLGHFNYVSNGEVANNPITAADAGDGFMMNLGYTIVDAGWQGDVAPGASRLFPNFPIATQTDGSPIIAPVRIEYSDRTIPAKGAYTLTLEGSVPTDILFTSYETSDTNTARSTLTVQNTVNGPKTPIAPDQWAFGRCLTGKASLTASTTDICLFGGFDPTKLYELIYPAKNPRVMGLGGVVTRDLASFLRHQTKDDAGNPNPLAASPSTVGLTRVYSFGSSSTGMYQREFLYLGFNEDESKRKVFDAMWIHKAGSNRLFANVEFADPNTYARQEDRHDFLSTTIAPITFGITTDPLSGIKDGLLKRPTTDPLVFDTDTSNEFWQMRASLKVQDGRGNPLPVPPDNVRMYFLSSFPHSGANLTAVPGSSRLCANPTNPIYHAPTLRALLIAFDAWADRGVEPPPSSYPRIEDGTLVTLADYQAVFPKIPNVNPPTVLNGLETLDFGPQFGPAGGRLTVLPPVAGASYMMMVPRPDADGMDIADIRPMEIAAPLGTNLGWNIRAPGAKAPNLCALLGSFVPFAATREERVANGDSRLSLQERYGTHAGYVEHVTAAAKHLVDRRFLLPADAARFIRDAEASNILRK